MHVMPMEERTVAEIRIRNAEPADASLLLCFVRQLAEYERMSEEVCATEEDFREALSGTVSKVSAHIAEMDGEPVGATIFFETFSTFAGRPKLYLEDIIVSTEARRQGVGQKLIDSFVAEAEARGCVRMEWQVLDWNAPAHRFYQQLGAERVRDWIPYIWTPETLD